MWLQVYLEWGNSDPSEVVNTCNTYQIKFYLVVCCCHVLLITVYNVLLICWSGQCLRTLQNVSTFVGDIYYTNKMCVHIVYGSCVDIACTLSQGNNIIIISLHTMLLRSKHIHVLEHAGAFFDQLLTRRHPRGHPLITRYTHDNVSRHQNDLTMNKWWSYWPKIWLICNIRLWL